jgi:telomerase reverse transcriptase
LSTSQKASHALAELAHAHCSKEGIVSFLSSVLKAVFPIEFWGSDQNFRSFLESVRSFVHLRRNEKLANKNLMHGISITAMEWLYPSSQTVATPQAKRKKKKGRHNSSSWTQRTNHEATTELTLQALRWVFKGFVIPLLRSCFYVTETEFDARELHYYRKPVWSLFRALSFQKLTAAANVPNHIIQNNHIHHQHFRALSFSQAKEFLSKQRMGISKLRLLPKATGMRPIAQLSRGARFEFPAAPPSGSTKRPRSEERSPGEQRSSKTPRVGGAPTGSLVDGLELSERDSNPSPSPSPSPSSAKLLLSRLPTNTILENVLDVLTYECDRRHRPYGNGLGNLRQFYVRYREYMLRLQQRPTNHNRCNGSNNHSRKLFFAKVDIEKCYDRIDQEYLLDLVQNLVSHNTYVVQTVKMDCANLRKKSGNGDGENALRFKKIVEAIEDYRSFHHNSEPSLATQHRNTVFELLKCSLVDKHGILELLREHLLHHIVFATGKHGPRLLLQSRGISQGSTLSMLLCNLYYGRVERSMLPSGKHCRSATAPKALGALGRNSNRNSDDDGDATDLVSRFVDDFLLVTPDRDSFREFLDKTHRGNPHLGAQINPGKTLVNVDASVTVPTAERGTQTVALSRSDRVGNNGRRLFPWCGLLFDTHSGEVLVDYERFRDGKIRRSLTIDADGSEGEKLSHRLKAFLFPRCLPILYDSSINSYATIAANFFQMMLFGACKTKEYLVGLNGLTKKHPYHVHNTEHLLKCIRGLAGYAIKNVRSKSVACSREPKSGTRGAHRNRAFGLDPRVASALSLRAFCDVFSYGSGFGAISRLLHEEFLLVSKGIGLGRREELRKVSARALDDFRINTMIEK